MTTEPLVTEAPTTASPITGGCRAAAAGTAGHSRGPAEQPAPGTVERAGVAERRDTFSVVICAYTHRRWDATVAAVRSVQHQTAPPLEIVVVIDHSPSLLRRAATMLPALAPGRPLRVLPSQGPKGLSAARNTGVALAAGTLVAFLDDDARAEPDWLERLLDAYRDPSVLGVGGKVIPAWERSRPPWFPPEFDWVVGCTHRGVRTDLGPVRNFIGANMSFRRAVVQAAGGFREELGRVGTVPLGCEETELCIRAVQGSRGGRLVYDPDARVAHSVPGERTTWRYFRSRCWAEGISKAAVSRLAGSDAALETERSYLLRVLPRGVAHSLRRATTEGPAAATAAAAIVGGAATTAAGYLVGRRAGASRATAEGRLRRAGALAVPAMLVAAVVCWALSLRHVALASMTDLGLMTVMPVTFWVALGLLTLAFSVANTRRRRKPWQVTVSVLVLIAVLHATPAILYGTLRYAWAWKHVAVIDYILRHGHLNLALNQLSAYQAWPGFFVLNAVIVSAGGLHSALAYAQWGPPVFEAAFLGPLLLIFRQFSSDRRLVWGAVWLFYLGNWIGQDYFSPQATAYFLYLVVIAVVLRWVLPRALPGGELAVRPAWHPSRVRTGLLLLAPIAAVATTHQLTPLMIVAAFAGLVVFRQRMPKWLLVGAAVVTLGWILLAARSFLAYNLYWIVRSIGHPDANAASTLVNLSRVDAGQALVAQIDRLLSASMWVLAAVGFVRRWSLRRMDRRFAVLAVTPLPLIVSNSYGGEMLFRVYFFALPFVALFAASAFFPRRHQGWSRRTVVTVTVVASLLLTGFCYSYYGKEQTNYFSPAEVRVGAWVYQHAPPGTLVVSAISDWPYSQQDFDLNEYDWFALQPASFRRQVIAEPAATLAKVMDPKRHPHAYLVFTRSEKAEIAALGLLPPGAEQKIQDAVMASPLFRVVYADGAGVVLARTAQPAGSVP